MAFTDVQIKQLLQPINPERVLRDGKGNAHVAQQDVTAHLTRIFGFGGWSKKVTLDELVFEQERMRDGKPTGRWDVCYKARVVLTVKDADGNDITSFEDGSCGVAQNQNRGDAHDLARKSAISLSTKRAAKDLGDQFGLSLYNGGQMTALVGATLVGVSDEVDDVEAHVEQQVSLGNDEIDREASPADKARDELRQLCQASDWDLQAVADAFASGHNGRLADASEDEVKAFIVVLKSGAVKVSA